MAPIEQFRRFTGPVGKNLAGGGAPGRRGPLREGCPPGPLAGAPGGRRQEPDMHHGPVAGICRAGARDRWTGRGLKRAREG
jgi:hypothetical protein